MISLCMIVKNEEKNLHRSLTSAAQFVDELLVTDTGSTDDTIKIAENFKAKVSFFEWNNNFSDARNYSIKNANEEYILFLDADEEISLESWHIIKNCISRNKGKAFRLTLKSKMQSGTNYGKSTRLFPNTPFVKFAGKAHEQVDNSLIENNIEIIDCEAEIIHHGYDVDEEDLLNKAERNLHLLLSDYKTGHNSFVAFHIGVSYDILKKYDEAIHYYEIALFDDNLYIDYKVYALRSISLIHFKMGKDDLALNYLQNAIEIQPNQAELYFLVSKILVKNRKFDEALSYCKKGLSFKQKSNFVVRNDFDIDELIYHALDIALNTNQKNDFSFFLNKLSDKSIKEIIKNLHQEIFKEDDFNTINELMNKMTESLLISLILKLNKTYQEKILQKLDLNKIESEQEIIRIVSQIDSLKLDIDSAKILNQYLLKNESPAVLTYLISIYLEKNNLEKVAEILKKLNEMTNKYPELQRYVDILNTQLMNARK